MTIFLSVVQPTFASSSFWYIKIKSYICRGNPFNSSINKKKSKPVPTEADEGSSVEFISQTWAAEVGETLHHHQHPLSWLVVTTDLGPPWWFGEHQSVLSRYIRWCRHLQYLVTSWSIIWSYEKMSGVLRRRPRVMFGITFLVLLLAALTLFTPKTNVREPKKRHF